MYRKVLVPLDGSKLAECVVEHVKSIATGCQVPTVVLLRVVEPISPPSYFDLRHEMDEDTTYRDAKETAEAQAKNYLSEMAERLKAGLKAEGTAVENDMAYGLPADEILNYAEQKQVDLIVMSTHGRSGISRWFSGSVSEKIVRQSLIPVLIVTPRGCRKSK